MWDSDKWLMLETLHCNGLYSDVGVLHCGSL